MGFIKIGDTPYRNLYAALARAITSHEDVDVAHAEVAAELTNSLGRRYRKAPNAERMNASIPATARAAAWKDARVADAFSTETRAVNMATAQGIAALTEEVRLNTQEIQRNTEEVERTNVLLTQVLNAVIALNRANPL